MAYPHPFAQCRTALAGSAARTLSVRRSLAGIGRRKKLMGRVAGAGGRRIFRSERIAYRSLSPNGTVQKISRRKSPSFFLPGKPLGVVYAYRTDLMKLSHYCARRQVHISAHSCSGRQPSDLSCRRCLSAYFLTFCFVGSLIDNVIFFRYYRFVEIRSAVPDAGVKQLSHA